jgi:adenylate cyclase
LLESNKNIVIQGARKREIDNQVFKYVGVGGIDKARIVWPFRAADLRIRQFSRRTDSTPIS